MDLWRRLFNRPGPEPVRKALEDGYPRSYPATNPDDGGQRLRLFDPALGHFPRAFRAGDPSFAEPEVAARWAGLRRLATDHVLRLIAESAQGDRLVLRGSRLLKAWLGEMAREPGDLDWVVDPPSLAMASRDATAMFGDLTAAVLATPGPPGVEFDADRVATDDIWTYERAPGRRVVFPWRTPGLPGGSVQVDVVFGEALAEPARREAIALADGGSVVVRAATPGLSLAWKLLWLATDMHPQGKDLYDAVLLAERHPLRAETLMQVLSGADVGTIPTTAEDLVGRFSVEWDHFLTEFPGIAADPAHWLDRLVKALPPDFNTAPS